MSHKLEDFIGAWQLKDWRIEYSDGGITRPFGEQATGLILYTQDGTMSASICVKQRPRFPKENARRANMDQKSEAFDSYFHYAGLWKLEGDTVVHTVTMSLNPNMAGTEQRRLAIFKDNSLTLSATEKLKNGIERHHILEWMKLP